MKFSRVALAAGLVLAAAPAAAVEALGTFAGSIVGVSASDPSIGVGTTFVNTFTTFISSGTGDFAALPNGATVTLGNVLATDGAQISFSGAFGNFVGTASNVFASGPDTNRVVSLYALGTFTPSGLLSSYDAGEASLTFSFTQTGGVGSAVSGSFTFAAPPAPPSVVPEPASWGLMILGFGLVGASMRRGMIKRVAA